LLNFVRTSRASSPLYPIPTISGTITAADLRPLAGRQCFRSWKNCSRFGQIGKGVALAGAIAALSLTTPTSAYAGGNGVGAAIGLGILGGVIAGAVIANSTQPAYGYGYGYGYGYAPAPAYDYPPQPYQGYYAPAPLIGEAHGDAVVGEDPEFFDQTVTRDRARRAVDAAVDDLNLKHQLRR
jgi:hypothetical protein